MTRQYRATTFSIAVVGIAPSHALSSCSPGSWIGSPIADASKKKSYICRLNTRTFEVNTNTGFPS